MLKDPNVRFNDSRYLLQDLRERLVYYIDFQDDINELESKVEEKRKENEETAKNVKKLDRKYKEALMILEEERKHLSRQQEEYESNQIKVIY